MNMGELTTANITRELGINALPLEQQRETIDRVGGLIFQAVVMRATEFLNETDRKTLEELFSSDKATGDEIIEFLKLRVDTLENIVSEEIGKFKSGALDFLDQVTKSE